MNEPTVAVMYSCKLCNTVDCEVQVPERYTDEPVVEWTNMAIHLIGRHHRHYQPQCISAAVDVKIPLPPNAKYIGEAVRQ